MKPFKSHHEQLEIIESRNAIIDNKINAIKLLQYHNYYSVINGYDDIFIDESFGESKKYIQGTSFEKIFGLYNFDKKIRPLFFNEIISIEHKLKSVISYEFSKNYGHNSFLNMSNFNITGKTPAITWTRQKYVSGLITKIYSELARHQKKDYIKAYEDRYGYVPLWILVNVISFGTIVNFFENMTSGDQHTVSTNFGIPSEQLLSFLKVLRNFRNACAHNERVYCLQGSDAIAPEKYLRQLGMDKYSKKDLLALLVILKYFLPQAEYSYIFGRFSYYYKDCNHRLTKSEHEKLRRKMGFSYNWKDLRDL